MKFAIMWAIDSTKEDLEAALGIHIPEDLREILGASMDFADETEFPDVFGENGRAVTMQATLSREQWDGLASAMEARYGGDTMGMVGHAEAGGIGWMPALAFQTHLSAECVESLYVCPLPDGEPREPLPGWTTRYFERAAAALRDMYRDRG